MTFDEAPIVGDRPPTVQTVGEAAETAPRAETQLLIAIDPENNWILIDGYAPLTGGNMFKLMAELMGVHCRDRDEGKRPENYRTRTASELADLLALSDVEGVRQVVARIRSELKEGYAAFGSPAPSRNELIENAHGKGYRINPHRVGSLRRAKSGVSSINVTNDNRAVSQFRPHCP